MAADLERYWSGPPQAIGIDLSPSLVHAVQANGADNFTRLGSINPDDNYARFMYELFELRQADSRNWMAEWALYARWSWFRTAIRIVKDIAACSRWTLWIGDMLPNFKPDSEWRYTFKTSLGDPVQVEAVSWGSWIRGMLPKSLQWHRPGSDPTIEEPSTPLPLTKSNFVDVLAAALEAIKAEARTKHNVNITSAVVTKPGWILNELDKLVKEACLKAEIETFTLLNRVEAAMEVAKHTGKQKLLLLEQTGYSFRVHEASFTPDDGAQGSMSINALSAGWIPSRLMEELLQAAMLEEQAAARRYAVSKVRLAQEISKARALQRLQVGPNVGPGHDAWVVVRKLLGGSTLDTSLPWEMIERVEGEYIDVVQEAVEDMLRKNHDIHDLYTSDMEQDIQTARAKEIETARTIPALVELASWYKPIDALVILADLPDSPLLVAGGCRGLCVSPGWDKVDGFVNWDHDIAAKGAALDAMRFLPGWEEERQWERCQEDESQCIYDEWQGDEDESGRDNEVVHEEL